MKEEEIIYLLNYCEKHLINFELKVEDTIILKKYIENLQSQLKAKEEVIKEAREYIEKCNKEEGLSMYVDTWQHLLPILEILSKGENKEIEFDMLRALNEDLDDDVEMSNM